MLYQDVSFAEAFVTPICVPTPIVIMTTPMKVKPKRAAAMISTNGVEPKTASRAPKTWRRVAERQRLDRADAGRDGRPRQGRRCRGDPGDEPRRGGRRRSEDGTGEHDEVGADDDVAAALEEVAGGEDRHGSATVGLEGSPGVVGGFVGGGGQPPRPGCAGCDRRGRGSARSRRCTEKIARYGRADEPQLPPIGEAAGGEHDGSGDEDAEADSAVGDAAVARLAGVRGMRWVTQTKISPEAIPAMVRMPPCQMRFGVSATAARPTVETMRLSR